MKTMNEIINKRDFYHKQAAQIAAKHRKSVLNTKKPKQQVKGIDEVFDEIKEDHYRQEAAKLLAKAEHCRQKNLIANRRESLLKSHTTISQYLLNKIRSI